MEDLDVETQRSRRRTLWVVAGAVVLLAAAGIVRFVVPPPAARPAGDVATATSAPARPARTSWPAGEVGTGSLYLVADGEVHRIDVASGRLASTGIRLDAIDTRVTSTRDGVLVWLEGRGGRHVVGAGASGARAAQGALRSGDVFLPGGAGSVWTSSRAGIDTGAATTWRRVDTDGHVSAEAVVPGRAVSDGAGGLLSVTDGGFRRAYPPPTGALVVGDLLGSGPDGYLSRTCTVDGRCTASLHEVTSGAPRVVALAPPMEATPGSVSPGNRFVTLSVLGEPTGAVQVRSVDSPQVLRSFTEDGPTGGSATWLSDRWVAVISGNSGLNLYDAVADEAIRLDLPIRSTVQQLAWSAA